MKAKITKRLVDSIEPPERGDLKVYDDALTGFGLVVHTSGKKSFFIEYGAKGARKRMVLGQYGPMTPDAARTLAVQRLGEVAAGGDPLARREAQRAMPTFGEWAEEYMAGVRRRKKQPREDERFLLPHDGPKKHGRKRTADEGPHIAAVIVERWRKRKLDSITRRDIEAAMAEVAAAVSAARGSPGHTSANRWLASVRACFTAAVKAGLIKEHPALGITQYVEAPPRARVLSDAEFERVIACFEAIKDPHCKAAFVLLMDAGPRKSEVLVARWEDFDLDAGVWRIPSPKARKPQFLPLAPDTVAYLRGVERLGPWFVPGRDPSKPRSDLRGVWEMIREVAELNDVTMHDLRRTFGLHLARTAGLHIASKALRHADIRVTERVYAPLGIDEVRDAMAGMRSAREGKVAEMRSDRAGRDLPPRAQDLPR